MAIVVCGGKQVKGSLQVQGSKNAVLPIMAAALLTKERCVIENCPEITDVSAMADVINATGALTSLENNVLAIDPSGVCTAQIDSARGSEIRASVLMMGCLLSRVREVTLRYPGGCSIGSRPINFHLQAFRQMGAEICEEDEYVTARASEGLHGEVIELPFPSVGATENILLAAVCAAGTTWIKNAAREPEIVELCAFLQQMGAKIRGAGTSHIVISGTKQLHGCRWHLCTDRIAFLTYGLMAAGCGGRCFLGTGESPVPKEAAILARLGCELQIMPDGVYVTQKGIPKPVVRLCTSPYPGFPTDGQSLVMAALTKSSGISTLEEDIFDNRLQMVSQLKKMGANIDAVSNRARITGVTKLHGASVEAGDLRSGAGLLIAGAMADGETLIQRDCYIRRGYEDVVEQMRKLSLEVSWA